MNCFFFPLSYSHELLPYSFKTRPRIQDTGDAQRLQVKVQSYELGEEESSILQEIPTLYQNVKRTFSQSGWDFQIRESICASIAQHQVCGVCNLPNGQFNRL